MLALATGVAFGFGGLAFRQTDDITPWEYVVFRGLDAAVVAISLVARRHRSRLVGELRQVEPVHIFASVLIGTTGCVFIVSLDDASVAFVLVSGRGTDRCGLLQLAADARAGVTPGRGRDRRGTRRGRGHGVRIA